MLPIRLLVALPIVAIGLASCKTLTKDAGSGRAMDPNLNTVHLRIEVNKKIKTVVIELDPEAAPQTVANFKQLVSDGFYKGLAFHRVIPNYLVQTGDPGSENFRGKASWGLGGPGYTVPAEIGKMHTLGAVAMARLGDGENPSRESNGSQFYIALAPLPSLDGKYTVFGQVVSGLEVLAEMSRVPTDPNDIPKQRTEVYDMRLVRPEAVVAPTEKVDRADSVKIDPDAGPVERFIKRVW
jgi:peptidyl-prolyl cis-trans isomerase B (cyclophilin B)